MTSVTLARSYLEKARKRLRILDVLMEEEAYSDVVREAQEIVELALKGILRYIGIEPPKQHDVGGLLLEYRDRIPEDVQETVEELARISKWLRKERESTLEYTREDGERARNDARFVVSVAERVIR